MKNLTPAFSMAMICLSLLFSGCTTDLDQKSTTRELITNGQWTVSYYYAGQDRTAEFSDHSFKFKSNGTVEGNDGLHGFSGSWSTFHDVQNQEVLKLLISGQEPQLAELNQAWKVSSVDAWAITMSNGPQMQLELKKE